MMALNKKTYIVAAALAGSVALAGLAGVGIASAATGTKPASLVDELAQKFNLNKADVQAVFDQHRSEAQSDHEAKYEQRLAADVAAGKLTAAQKDQILAKHQEVLSFMESLKGKSAADRKAALDQERHQLQQWTKDNSIPARYVVGGLGLRGMGHRFGNGGA
ncbi:MAG TPA: hypothetical protein VLI05_01625 [Candidatus Saccharimonadia bacterium]|nr:hypothetical protein [Candidatus Saccharimonadia bacterium]